MKWWPGAESDCRRADFQFGYKTVSYGNLRKFRETLAVRNITQKALLNKRLRTLVNSNKISALYLYCTSAPALIGDSDATSPTQILILSLRIL